MRVPYHAQPRPTMTKNEGPASATASDAPPQEPTSARGVRPALSVGSAPGASGRTAGTTSSSASSTSSSSAPFSYERHTSDISRAILEFLAPILPTEEEYIIKEGIRRQLLEIARKVHPEAQMLAFGSMANGFALRNSDMDLCCLIPASEDENEEATAAAGDTTASDISGDDSRSLRPSPSELVEELSELIRHATDFHVLPLPKARIPIIKISRASTPDVPYDIACDIGFNNQVALENTRLLLSYAMLDPPRLRTLVLFIKVWTKRRKLNSPFMGTLSSYGYTLLVLFFLMHVKKPAVLPNLQRIPAGRELLPDEVMLKGHNIYFYDDMDALRRIWHSDNTESVGELLLDFFRYFSRDFNYTKDAISMRTEGGLVTKESRRWTHDLLCIEDPFQMGYNVARTVTKDGLYTIRGEFMRASRLLANRSIRAPQLLNELCMEREDGLTRAPDFPHHQRHHHDRFKMGRPRDAPSAFGGFGFDDMAARGLVPHGISYPPTGGMLAPFSMPAAYGMPMAPPPPPSAMSPMPTTAGGASPYANSPLSATTSHTPSAPHATHAPPWMTDGVARSASTDAAPYRPERESRCDEMASSPTPDTQGGSSPLANGMQCLSLGHAHANEWHARDDDDEVFGMSPT